jgi:hypothetical protein
VKFLRPTALVVSTIALLLASVAASLTGRVLCSADGEPLTMRLVQGLVKRATRGAGLKNPGVHILPAHVLFSPCDVGSRSQSDPRADWAQRTGHHPTLHARQAVAHAVASIPRASFLARYAGSLGGASAAEKREEGPDGV